jgi:hypothetical protein
MIWEYDILAILWYGVYLALIGRRPEIELTMARALLFILCQINITEALSNLNSAEVILEKTGE